MIMVNCRPGILFRLDGHTIASLDLPEEAKQRLLDLTPGSYIGLAASLAREI